MLTLHDHNKKVLSVLLFWLGLSGLLIAGGFFFYRLTTEVPNTEMTVAGQAARFVFALAVGLGALFYGRRVYQSMGTRASLADLLTGRVLDPDYVDTPLYAYEEGQEYLPPVELDAAGNPIIDIDERGRRSPLIRRVMDVIKEDTVVALDGRSLKYHADDDIDPSSFALVALRPGGLTDEKTSNRYNSLILKGIPEGRILWTMEEDPVHDRVWFHKKTPFPPIVLPDVPGSVVTDVDDARSRYADYRFVIGVDAFGEEILLDPKTMPHGMIIGGTGSGKSVFNRGLLEHMRVNGWQIVLIDGKVSDYVSMVNVPNVVAVGKKVEDWVRLTQFVLEQTTARFALAEERQKKGLTGDPFNQPPMVFLLDEFGSVVRDVRSRYGKKGLEAFYDDLKSIAAKARQAKIHMLIATQEIYAETFPGALKSNLSFIISLGVPDNNTLANAFSNETRPTATRIGQSIRKQDRGRGIIQIDTPDGAKVVEFQTYYGYSPGDPDGIPSKDPVKTAWTRYKEQASDKVPLLYPRMWWDEPHPDDLKEVETVEEMKELPMLPIQGRDGKILTDKAHLDRNGDDYIGDQMSADGVATVLGFDD